MPEISCEPGSLTIAAPAPSVEQHHRIARTKTAAPADGDLLIRTLDVSIAMAALLFFFPLMIVVAAAIYLHDRGPILFAHRRIGQGGRPFYCFKFRSMMVGAEARLAEVLARDPAARKEWANSYKLKHDPRITPLGLFLRRTSLDELPQLFNVLRGEMSIVGPRPIVDNEISRYGHRFRHYCAVKPGITGLWQVSGRTDVEYRSRVAMDVLYARSASPGLYLWLVVATVPAVLLRRGSY